jgi:hypothetical protein
MTHLDLYGSFSQCVTTRSRRHWEQLLEARPINSVSINLEKCFEDWNNWPRILNAASTKSITAIFSPHLPFVPSFLAFPCLDMFWVHVMLILDLVTVVRGYKTWYLAHCKFMSVKHGRFL